MAATPGHDPSPSAQPFCAGLPDRDENNISSQRPAPEGIMMDSSLDDDGSCPVGAEGKGKGRALESRLLALPSELIASILSNLSPADLKHVSETCRALYEHAMSDHLWQGLVQEHVPGVRVTSHYPCSSFRELFWAHDPRWFLPKYKIWFADSDLPGRLVVVRYDQRRGCIEGYQLLALRRSADLEAWQADSNVWIHSFSPVVGLHLDNPILRLPANPLGDTWESRPLGATRTIERRQDANDAENEVGGELGCHDGSEASSSKPKRQRVRREVNRFQDPIPMDLGSTNNMHTTFRLARPLDDGTAERPPSYFPYGNMWPPPAIPARHRVLGDSLYPSGAPNLGPADFPTCRKELSDRAFRIRKWIEVRIARGGNGAINEPGGNTIVVAATHEEEAVPPGDNAAHHHTAPEVENQIMISTVHLPGGHHVLAATHIPTDEPGGPAHNVGHLHPTIHLPVRIHIGETVSTYATLDPELYTPTPTKPYRGIWVGDYSGHGCEFVWIHQPDDDPAADQQPLDPESIAPRREHESDEEYARRKYDATVHRGRLEAVKLTGDAHVPRGEKTFVVDDLGEGGFVAVLQDPPFTGVRAVRSRGHIAGAGFVNDEYVDSQLFLISPDRLAHYWIGFGRISYFHRVDTDKLLVPN
ncbi:hypothetical protein VTK56DRAFT_3588 [Thermocarpiscus australiensis]